MLKDHIDRILEAEKSAKRIVADAESQARDVIECARAQHSAIVESRRSAARAESESLLKAAGEEAAREREKILGTAHARSRDLTGAADRVEESFIESIVLAIAGLEP